MRIFTTGVFDILHRGHLNILTQAAALGDLVVGIMTDQGVEDTKGTRPILTLEERDAQVRSLPFVSEVIHYTNVDQRDNYRSVKPDIVVQGDELEVLGDGAVFIVDGSTIRFSSLSGTSRHGVTSIFGVSLHVLSDGDRFDLVHRLPDTETAERELPERQIAK